MHLQHTGTGRDPNRRCSVVAGAISLQGTLMSTIRPTRCECGYDCADFIARHDISTGARFECPVCGAERTVSPTGSTSDEVDGDANGIILGEGQQHLTHDFR